MFLITEQNFENIDCLIESNKETGNKNFFIEGIFIQTNKINRNGRIYEDRIIKPIIEQYITEQINSGKSFGELEHPKTPKINLERVSHRITELKWDGDDVYGKALIVNTPMGNIVKGLLEGGGKLGVSSRGMGSLEKRNDGKTYVKDDFQLSTVDIVSDPSAREAWVNGILEGFEFIYNDTGKLIQSRIEKLEEQKIKQFRSESRQLKALKRFLSQL
jgi:hypothetical protein